MGSVTFGLMFELIKLHIMSYGHNSIEVQKKAILT